MISIVVPAYNQHDMTEECLLTVLDQTQDCEIIVVDNGSAPPIKPPFSGFIDTILIRNEENKGFPVAVNQGIAAAKGDVIILLNNDVIVTPGWAGRLLSAMADFSIVGPMTNYCAGAQCITLPAYHDKEGLNAEAGYLVHECEGMVEDVNFVIGFCMAFRKSLWEEVGPFDESLWPCCGEEIDFCLRAKKAGHRVGIVMDTYVHHEGSLTFQDMEREGEANYAEICDRNNEHLIKRWGDNALVQQIGPGIPTPGVIKEGLLCLNLGSGYQPQAGYVNIDNRAEVNPDVVCDVMEGLPYKDSSVDEVRAYDFLEHIPIGKTVGVMNEIWRVLKPGGRFESFTPSTDGRGAFQDPTHVSFWNRNSWLYYSVAEYRHLYGIEADFEIEKIEDVGIDDSSGVIHTFVVARARK